MLFYRRGEVTNEDRAYTAVQETGDEYQKGIACFVAAVLFALVGTGLLIAHIAERRAENDMDNSLGIGGGFMLGVGMFIGLLSTVWLCAFRGDYIKRRYSQEDKVISALDAPFSNYRFSAQEAASLLPAAERLARKISAQHYIGDYKEKKRLKSQEKQARAIQSTQLKPKETRSEFVRRFQSFSDFTSESDWTKEPERMLKQLFSSDPDDSDRDLIVPTITTSTPSQEQVNNTEENEDFFPNTAQIDTRGGESFNTARVTYTTKQSSEQIPAIQRSSDVTTSQAGSTADLKKFKEAYDSRALIHRVYDSAPPSMTTDRDEFETALIVTPSGTKVDSFKTAVSTPLKFEGAPSGTTDLLSGGNTATTSSDQEKITFTTAEEY